MVKVWNWREAPLLGFSCYADLKEAPYGEGTAILKLALETARESEGEWVNREDDVYISLTHRIPANHCAGGLAFITGGSVSTQLKPNEILLTETQTLQRIKHPAFVKVLAQGRAVESSEGLAFYPGQEKGKGRPYALLEKIGGKTWRNLLQSGTRPTLGQFRELIAALVAVQESGELTYHGDIKPDNILTDERGRIRLIDPCSGFNDRHRSEGILLYSQYYHPTVYLYEATSYDLPSLGIVLLEILTGKNFIKAIQDKREELYEMTFHELSPSALEYLRGLTQVGQGWFWEDLLQQYCKWSWLTGLGLFLNRELEALALRCLGLRRAGPVLDLAPPLKRPKELLEALILKEFEGFLRGELHLVTELTSISPQDIESFAHSMVQLGQRHNYEFTVHAVEQAITIYNEVYPEPEGRNLPLLNYHTGLGMY